MQAVILTGGLGTRLKSMYPDRPKALVPVAGKPTLQWLLEWLQQGGITDVHLAAGYMADAISSWIEKLEPTFERISLSEEQEPLGTAGAFKHAEKYIRSGTVLLTNGDSMMPHLDIRELLKAHAASEAKGTIAVTTVEDASRFGTIEFDAEHRVIAFKEKSNEGAGWINGGVYVLSRDLLSHIPPGEVSSIERNLFPALAEQGLLAAYQAPPPLLDMGTPEGLASMSDFFGTPS